MAISEPTEKECEAWYSELGWHFDENNDFVDKNDDLFEFRKYEAYYEYVHFRIKDHLFRKMKRQFDLVQQPVSMDNSGDPADPKDPYVPQIFVSKDVPTNNNLLIIVQGLGLVPPGQWARKLFTNGRRGEFKYASQFPYIQKAKDLGWSIILCDPNHALQDRPQSETTRAWHVQRVWEDVVIPSKAESVMIAAFSAGTISTLHLFDNNRGEFINRVRGVALMDGATGEELFNYRGGLWFKNHSHAFVLNKAKGSLSNVEEVPDARDHDTVPGAAIDSVFKYLERKLDEHKKGEEEDKKTEESQETTDKNAVTLKKDDDEDMEEQGKQDNATKCTQDENGKDVKAEEAESSKIDTGSPKANGRVPVDDKAPETHDESQANKSVEPDGSEKSEMSERLDGELEEQDSLDKGKKGGRKVEDMPSGDDQTKDADGAKRIRLQS
ncbi:hypothetical protein MVEG_05639 [Podila verticillata NRRL 6337]|nr:hypothetical protein MVEG_05639 [Podila verticillata NRRL 6337]